MPSLSATQLDATIEWKSAVTHGHQWVAIGTRNDRLHLARGNWYGHVEYYSWLADMNGVYVLLIADEQHGNRILLRTSAAVVLETKTLPKNKHFPVALTVECPSWLPPWPARVCLLPDGLVAAVTREERVITVQRYKADGELLPAWEHSLGSSDLALVDDERGWPCELLYHAGVFYTYWGHWLVAWSERGSNSFHELPIGVVCQVVRSVYSEELLLAIDAEEGFLLWAPTRPGEKKPTLAFTTGAAANVAIQFVAPAHLVVINEFGTALYQLAADGTELAHTIAMDTEPIAILSTINRQQFALLEATGRIILHQISHE